MLGFVGGLLLLAGALLFVVPAENIWPFVLLFWAVGGGLFVGVMLSKNAEIQRETKSGAPDPQP